MLNELHYRSVTVCTHRKVHEILNHLYMNIYEVTLHSKKKIVIHSELTLCIHIYGYGYE